MSQSTRIQECVKLVHKEEHKQHRQQQQHLTNDTYFPNATRATAQHAKVIIADANM